jgi:hypothetical protein
MADINVTEEIIDINVTEEVVNIIAPSGGYPLPNTINSVFGRVGNIVATEGDYTLTQLGDVTLTSPANGQVLKYNGTSWINDSDAGVTGSGTTNTLPKFTGASTIGNSNISDSGSLITLGSNTTISSGGLQIGPNTLSTHSIRVGKNVTGSTFISVVTSDGAIQSDATSNVWNFRSGLRTAAASFTLGNFTHFIADQASIGAGSSITTQEGYVVNSTMTGATNNYGFRGLIPSGANRWNLYMDGTANNFLAGKLALGSTAGSASRLVSNRLNLTGGTLSIGYEYEGTIQSDVTSEIRVYSTFVGTQAASFTLANLTHYYADRSGFGAGSTVTTQNGFYARANLIGATNNYGFRGSIPVGSNTWNLYMDGTAANYLAGDTAIGTTTLGTATQLTVGGTETAVSAISRGQLINTTLVASANSDNLIGLDIAPTFTNGAFTGVTNLAIRASSLIASNNGGFYGAFVANSNRLGNNNFSFSSHSPSSGVANQIYSGSRPATPNTLAVTHYVGTDTQVYWDTSNAPYNFLISGTQYLKLFNSTGNLLLQNGGTFTDAGFRLDVNGLTRFIGTATSDTAQLGSELAAVTGTGTNWTLAGTNLNVGGYTHTVGSVDPLTTALSAVNGTYYQIAYTITGRTTGSITINYGGTALGGITATGTTGPLASSTAVLTITPTTDFNGTIVLSIKSIGTSVASSTFASSALVVATEIRASDISSNLFFGRNNGRRNTTGTNNTFVGSQAGINNTTGNFNTFLGQGAGIQNTIGGSNTFLGINAGNVNTTGGSNTFVGAFVGQSNTTGTNNTFVGLNSGTANTTGGSNTFVGRDAGSKNTTASNNTFLGLSAGQENTTGENNVYLGNVAGQLNTTGGNNTAVGYLALNANVGGSLNVVLGQQAGRFIANKSTTATVLNNSIMIGYRTSPLANSETNQIVIGHDAIGLGSNTTIIGTTATTITGLYGNIRLVSGMGTAPASATATGTTGDIVVTAGFIYVCTATNTWVRTALTTW